VSLEPRAEYEVAAGEDGVAQLRQPVAHESWCLLLGVREVDFLVTTIRVAAEDGILVALAAAVEAGREVVL
jgi:hypothetical protein